MADTEGLTKRQLDVEVFLSTTLLSFACCTPLGLSGCGELSDCDLLIVLTLGTIELSFLNEADFVIVCDDPFLELLELDSFIIFLF